MGLSEPITRRSRLAWRGMAWSAFSGAASPWAGEDGGQLASHHSFLANSGVRSVMKRGAGAVKRKSEKKSGGGGTEKKKKKKKGGKGKKERNIKKGKNRKGKKSRGEKGKGKLKKGK